LPDIIRPTYCQLLWHNNYAKIYSCFWYLFPFSDLFPGSAEDVEKAL
jgi:hypothetical protein